MKWFKDHVMAVVSGLVLSAFVAWQLFVSHLGRRRAERKAAEETAKSAESEEDKAQLEADQVTSKKAKESFDAAVSEVHNDKSSLGDLVDRFKRPRR